MQQQGNESGKEGNQLVSGQQSPDKEISGAVYTTEHDHEHDNDPPLKFEEIDKNERQDQKKTVEKEFPSNRKPRKGSKISEDEGQEAKGQKQAGQVDDGSKPKSTGFFDPIKQKLEHVGAQVLNFIGSRDPQLNDDSMQVETPKVTGQTPEQEPKVTTVPDQQQDSKVQPTAPKGANLQQQPNAQEKQAKTDFLNALSMLSHSTFDPQMNAETAFQKGTEFINFVIKKSQEVLSRNTELVTSEQRAKSQFLKAYFSEFKEQNDYDELSIQEAFDLATDFVKEAKANSESHNFFENSDELEYLCLQTTEFLDRRRPDIYRFREIWPKNRRPDRADFTQLRQTLQGSKSFDFLPGNDNLLPTLMMMYKLEKELKDRQQQSASKEGVQNLEAFERIIGGFERELESKLGKSQLQVSLLKNQAESALKNHSAEQLKAEVDEKDKQIKALINDLGSKIKELENSQRTVLEHTKELAALKEQLKTLGDTNTGLQADLDKLRQLLAAEKTKTSELQSSKEDLERYNENFKIEVSRLSTKMTQLEDIRQQQVNMLDLKERQIADYKLRETLQSQRIESTWDKTGISYSRIEPPTNIHDETTMSFVRGPRGASSANPEDQKETTRDSSNQELVSLIQTFKTLKQEYTKKVTDGTHQLKDAKVDKNNQVLDLTEKVQALENELKTRAASDRALTSKTPIHTFKEAFPYFIIGVLIIVILRLRSPV